MQCFCRELFQLGVRCFDIDVVTTADRQLLVTHPKALQVRFRYHRRANAVINSQSSVMEAVAESSYVSTNCCKLHASHSTMSYRMSCTNNQTATLAGGVLQYICMT